MDHDDQENRFYRLSGTGSGDSHPKNRCYGYLDIPGWDVSMLIKSQSIKNWQGGRLIIEPGMALDDMPWNTKDEIVVSDMLKRLLQTNWSDHAEFLPLSVVEASWDLTWKDEKKPLQIREDEAKPLSAQYWVLNSLTQLDCMIPELAKRNAFGVHINSRCIPANVALFRDCARRTLLLCRGEVRRVCEDYGIRGPQFRPVPSS